MGVVLKVRGLNVWMGKKWVLKDVDLDVYRNSVLAIMGPSGSGKSTLLRVLDRIIELDPEARVSGTVEFDGRSIFSMDVHKLRKKIGMVFQKPNPFPHMSIYDNIAYGVRMNGMAKDKRSIDDVVESSLKKAYLWDEVKGELKKKAGKLSGGQQQRLCIARALALNPSILLMDEPTSMIDVVAARKIEELVVNLKEELTVIIVTHNPLQAARISDYVAFLYDGRMVEEGPTKDIFTNPKNQLTEKYVLGKVV